MELTAHTRALIELALMEDMSGGDITTRATITDDHGSRAVVTAKEDIVLAGIEVFKAVFKQLGGDVLCTEKVTDGDFISGGMAVMEVEGSTATLLGGERTALNFLMRLSGIATLTRRCVDSIAGTGATVVDTRKTTPGWRYLEKYAVRMGGGRNHRYSLSDGVLIKDNHITASGGITEAVNRAKKTAPHTSRIEVEVSTTEQITEALNVGADILLLDNMTPDEIADAVTLIDGRALIEASGGITLENIRKYAEAGVDFISLGALTHGARSVDINMKIVAV
ncbi:MAG: carboxylating nicotinate-nucleotide diphosphorylase [Deltaproteobacteria bacterium]|nr:carboxylating nicotinate-nucleotide diphosphorylase [Candidatus Zymogenaceae bacterium]